MNTARNCSNAILLGKLLLTSYYMGYKATTAGAKHQEALNHLEKKLKKDPELNQEETIEVLHSNCSWL